MVIYKIENNINGKIYIGKTTRTFKDRYSNNWPRNTHNIFLRVDVDLYGIENFFVNENFDHAESLIELDEKERYWIAFYNSTDIFHGYNIKGKSFTIKEYVKLEMNNMVNYSINNQSNILKSIKEDLTKKNRTKDKYDDFWEDEKIRLTLEKREKAEQLKKAEEKKSEEEENAALKNKPLFFSKYTYKYTYEYDHTYDYTETEKKNREKYKDYLNCEKD